MRPSRSQIEDFAFICSMDEGGLRTAFNAIRSYDGRIIDREKIDDTLESIVGPDAALVLSRVIFSVATPLRQNENFSRDAFDGVESAIEHLPPSLKEKFASWPKYRVILEDFVSDKSVKLTAKARDIAYDFERLYTTSRFLTSIRPVFNDDRTEILGAAIVQTLRVEFLLSSGETQTMSIAFDANDIEQLRDACEDALRKGRVAHADLDKHWKIPVSMIGVD